jgi:hypothetical protein
MEGTTSLVDNLGTMAAAIVALGMAATGIVDGMKTIRWVDLAGFERLFTGARWWLHNERASLDPFLPVLRLAYGEHVLELLKAQYAEGRTTGALPTTLRQGVRLGLSLAAPEARTALARELALSPATIELIEATYAAGGPQNDAQRAAIARFESAIDARLEAALGIAAAQYTTQLKMTATAVAIVLAHLVWLGLTGVPYVAVWIVGLAAVPLAPVGKDLASALAAAVDALRLWKLR